MLPIGRQQRTTRPLDLDLRVKDLPSAERRVVVDRPVSQPIFLIGDRSGHLGAMLDAHPDISFTTGSGFLSGLVRAVSDNRDTLSFYGYPEQYWLQSIARFYDNLQCDHAASRGRTRWADAAQGDEVDLVDRLFPRCQVVHVTGDRGEDTGRGRSARSRRARAAGKRMPAGRYCEVPHTNLRAEPEKTMRALLAFLGDAWDPAVAEPPDSF